MTDRYLYTVSIPEQAQTTASQQGRREVAQFGSLTQGDSPAKPLGVEPGERTLRVQYKGYNDDIMAQMLNELARSGDIEAAPYYGVDTNIAHVQTEEDGYYAVEHSDRSLPDARSENFPESTLSMRKIGTQKTHWREVTMNATVIENPFGNDTSEAVVGLPANARKVRWWDGDIDTQTAAVSSTVTCEFGSVDIYDHGSAPYALNHLIYELPYDAEGEVDVKLWDSRGSASKTATVGSYTVVEWQKVFHPDHEFFGDCVLSNGRVRLTLDEEGQTQSAEEYTGGSWSALALGASDWAIFDVDPLTISEEHLEVQTIWEDTSDGSTYILNALLRRGDTRVQFYIPENLVDIQGTIPAGLDTLLSPVAGASIKHLNQNQGIVARSEVRQ